MFTFIRCCLCNRTWKRPLHTDQVHNVSCNFPWSLISSVSPVLINNTLISQSTESETSCISLILSVTKPRHLCPKYPSPVPSCPVWFSLIPLLWLRPLFQVERCKSVLTSSLPFGHLPLQVILPTTATVVFLNADLNFNLLPMAFKALYILMDKIHTLSTACTDLGWLSSALTFPTSPSTFSLCSQYESLSEPRNMSGVLRPVDLVDIASLVRIMLPFTFPPCFPANSCPLSKSSSNVFSGRLWDLLPAPGKHTLNECWWTQVDGR